MAITIIYFKEIQEIEKARQRMYLTMADAFC